jgi:hypothetical protein
VRGGQYAFEKGKPAATAADVASSIVAARAVALDPNLIKCDVKWDSSNWPLTTTNYSQPKGNTVTVTVSYQWMPEFYLAGPITLSSSSTAQMLY